MQSIVARLKPAQEEVHRTAHNQDLVEVPKQATLDRAAEGKPVDVPAVEQVNQIK
jgi:hypothetical protein